MKTFKLNTGQQRMHDVLTNDQIIRILAVSGSRSGKTFEFIRSLIRRALNADESRHGIIRKNFSQAKRYIWYDTFPQVINTVYPKLKPLLKEDKSDYYYKFPNGSEIWLGGLDDKERADKILGAEYNTIYFNEVSEIMYESVETALTRLAKKSYLKDGRQLINKAYFDCNPPAKNHWSYKLFFEHIDPKTRIAIPDPETYAKVHLKPEENKENLADNYVKTLANLTGSARLRFYEGLYQEEITGALWREDTINRTRVNQYPSMERIIIAVDPAVTKKDTSDETGIVVAGLGFNGHLYVLEDLSGYYTPGEWAAKVVNAYNRWEADLIVGETNNGGDLVETNILNYAPGVGFLQIHASRGKITRAEPISSLYERGVVHHVGQFTDLEYQMTTYTGYMNEKDQRELGSPDRMDAMVYALTELANPSEQDDGIVLYSDRVNIDI
jgi:hypothetical protein